jgi:D-alanine-D-alanine ligase-like ATP-grasp enzyme
MYFSLRARSFFFFSAANPSIKNGGMAMESKNEIYQLIPKQYIPKTILVNSNAEIADILEEIINAEIHFPLIVKPDIGMKAFAVAKIENKEELAEYQKKIDKEFLIQELILFPNEMGIFYVRLPTEEMGQITGIVSKEFLSVTGNGVESISSLIQKNPRSHFQLGELKKRYGNYLETILPSGENFILVPYGSHTRGALFLDYSSKINEKLLKTVNDICGKIPGFYFGRMDIRYDAFEDLVEGKNFSIIEINGAGSEPTHIYDPAHSLYFAWKEIIRHWKILYQISMINHQKGHPFMSYANGMEMLQSNSALEKKLKKI